MTQLPEAVRAIRHGVALSEMDAHVRTLRISGSDAFDALDFLCPRDLFLHDGQIFQSLFLHEDGRPFADIMVGADDEDFLIFAEGPTGADLVDWMRQSAPHGLRFEIEDLTPRYTHLSLDGPYAWECLAALLGPEVIGLPYLTFFETRYGLCLRAGKTGEYGYSLIAPPDRVAELRERIAELGGAFDLTKIDLATLDHCALENWFFNIRSKPQAALTPYDLQLRWRLSPHKEYFGSASLRRHQQSRRVTSIVSQAALESGAAVAFDGETVGAVLECAWSAIRGDWVGLACIDLRWAHPGLRFTVGGADVTSVSAPFLDNHSLYVNPQKHSYATRHEHDFHSVTAP